MVCATRFSAAEREKDDRRGGRGRRCERAGVRFLGLEPPHARARLGLVAARRSCCAASGSTWSTRTSSAPTSGASCSAASCGVPVVVTHEHGWSFEGRAKTIIDRELIARGSNAFIAVSREDRRRMIELEKIKPEDAIFVAERHPGAARRPPAATCARSSGIGAGRAAS